MIIVSMLLIIVMNYTISLTEMVRISSDNLIARNKIKELESEVDTLKELLRTQGNLDRIEHIAKNRLGMRAATEKDFVVLKKDEKAKLITLDKSNRIVLERVEE